VSREVPNCARPAGTVDVVVIGAGHSGLAISWLLTGHGIAHVVLERGEVANAWRERRWSSLRLLTPNQQTRLPGFAYDGESPEGFMRVQELVRFLENYAAWSGAPVLTQADVNAVRQDGAGYLVTTTRGDWRARAVVLASGASAVPKVPALARNLPARIAQLTPLDYRSPAQIEPGSILIVGASATGVQFADELARAGRDVTIATGEHVRMPRLYRGRDITEWMHSAGIFNERYDEIDDVLRGRRLPSPQLVGDSTRPILDLNSLRDAGVRVAGRLMGVRDGKAQFSGSLRNVCALADLKMHRLLGTLDAHIDAHAGPAAPAPEQFQATRVDKKPMLTLKLDAVGTIIWATGFRPDFGYLRVPVLDRKGNLQHERPTACTQPASLGAIFAGRLKRKRRWDVLVSRRTSPPRSSF
jgi:putative flavoprotein involved in K+ transport